MEFTLCHRSDAKNPAAKGEITIQCYFNRRYRYIKTGIFIEPVFWNVEKKCVNTKHSQYATINHLLKAKISSLEKACFDAEYHGGVFDFIALKSHSGNKSTQSFCDFVHESIKKETKLDYKTVIKYLSNVEIMRKCLGDIAVDKLLPSHIKKLDAYLRDQYAQSTVARLHIFVNKYTEKAVKAKMLKDNPYDAIEIDKSKGESSKTFLTMDEITAIENIQGLPASIAVVRDRFLYSCYTGLRISDNLALLKSMLTDTPDGYVVSLHTIKGYGHDLIHPLKYMFNGKPDAIIRRWINTHDEPTVFPRISDSSIYEALKLIKELAGIEKRMNFHISRHTCATHLANITLNPFLLMNIMGWSDVKTAMGYVHSSPENTKRQLKLIGEDWTLKAL